ncbi:glycoside hydrolase family 25 protein [Jiella sp. M17.18]|uniref:glycoside hydrolase family 25 protein n=1 Tax=Jiella sp. M17.18 TaxID=3234247 RepID=UPI0034DE5AE8
MTKPSTAAAVALNLACALILSITLAHADPAKANWDEPWKASDKALVVDAYEFNPIDWAALTSDKRIAGFINKASDGLPPDWKCSGDSSSEDYKLCKNRWWKYTVTKELYQTRRQMAKMKGLLWGAYHLGRPGNPREQADHFVDFADPQPDDLLALDIEDRGDEWMSLSDAEIFANQVKIRTGRYPVLYTNGSTAKYISEHKADLPLLSRLPIWYARYRDDITDKFPTDTWPTYALWQFSSMHNCTDRSCPYRVKGAKNDIDVNVSTYNVADLRKAWPFDKLIDAKPDETDPAALVASVAASTKTDVAKAATVEVARAETAGKPAAANAAGEPMLAAYGPAEHHPTLDPLKMLTGLAREEHDGAVPSAAEAQAGHALRTAASASPAKPVPSTLSGEAVRSVQAHVGDLSQAISVAARDLDRMLANRTEAATRAKREADRKAEQRSRILKVIAAAEAEKEANALPMPARVLSQLGTHTSERGPRVISDGNDDQSQFAALDRNSRRIAGAFAATR